MQMSSQNNNNYYYTTVPTSPNPYITRKLNNMDEAKMMKAKRDNWTRTYLSYTSPPVQKTTSLRWCHLWTLQARLPRRPPFSQHVIWWCCNPLDIPSFMAEILLFNSVFHDGVAPVSVSTLKPLLGAIGVVTTETLSISYIITLYIRLVVTL